MKSLLLSAAIILSLSFYPNDAEKKTYWRCSYMMEKLIKGQKATYFGSEVVEAKTEKSAERIFLSFIKNNKDLKDATFEDCLKGCSGNKTYCISKITPSSILK